MIMIILAGRQSEGFYLFLSEEQLGLLSSLLAAVHEQEINVPETLALPKQ